MKTKNLMTAFALSTVFAACTQDTELNETLAKNDFSNVPMVEANFTVNAGVDSRMATKFGWEVDDKVGLAWLGGDIKPFGWETDGELVTSGPVLNGKAYQNHPLYCTDATNAYFATKGMLYIGNYFAYLPYTEGNMTTEEITLTVTGQTLSTNSDDLAKSAIFISPKLTSLEKPNSSGKVNAANDKAGIGNNVPLNIARVSNAATINLSFVNTAKFPNLKVTAVEIAATHSGQINGETNADGNVLPKSITYAPTTSQNITTWKNNFDKFSQAATYNPGTIKASSKDGITVVNDALTVYMLTMPYTTAPETFTVKVSTNYGDVLVPYDGEGSVYGEFEDPRIAFDGDMTASTTDLTNTDLFNNLGSAGSMEVYVDMASIKVGSKTVSTQAELEQQLELLVTSGYKEPVTYTIQPSTKNRRENFVLTDFTLPEGLDYRAVITLETGDNAVNGFVFSGNTVINKRIVLSSPAVVQGTMTANTITNPSNANDVWTTIDGSSKITVDNNAEFINKGKVLAPIETIAPSETDETLKAGRYVSANANASQDNGTFTNNGEIKWIAGTLPSVNGLVYAEVIDFTTLNHAAVKGVTTARFVTSSTFANGGLDITLPDALKKIEIYAPVTVNITKNGVTGNAVTIEFPGLTNTQGTLDALKADEESPCFVVAEGGSLTINSDDKNNKIKFGEFGENGVSTTTSVMLTAKGTTLDFTKLTFAGLSACYHEGDVKTTGVEGVTFSAVGDGEHTSGN